MPQNVFQPSPLVTAIRTGRLSDVIRAIEDGADLEAADIHGIRGLPLRTACFEGSMAIVRELLRCGADINALAVDGPGAPLRLALRGGHGDIAALLLQNGAEIPSGLVIDPAILDRVGTHSPLPGEVPVPTLPASDNTPEPTNKPAIDFMIEEVEPPAGFGTETKLLALDLLPIDEAPAGFWKSSRST
ncbi:MAG: hypothetical protein HYU74_04740 [Dechloromonas sp.]|nr:hypothetical protein [Dechloromonas sp.]